MRHHSSCGSRRAAIVPASGRCVQRIPRHFGRGTRRRCSCLAEDEEATNVELQPVEKVASCKLVFGDDGKPSVHYLARWKVRPCSALAAGRLTCVSACRPIAHNSCKSHTTCARAAQYKLRILRISCAACAMLPSRCVTCCSSCACQRTQCIQHCLLRQSTQLSCLSTGRRGDDLGAQG